MSRKTLELNDSLRSCEDDFEFNKFGTIHRKDRVIEILRAMSAEFLGSFFLIFIGIGVSIQDVLEEEADHQLHTVTNAIVMGSMQVAMNFILTSQSGSIFNPAVTLSLMLIKKISVTRGFLYMIAQILGSTFGALLLKLLLPDNWKGSIEAMNTNLSIGLAQGVIVEALLTMVIVMVVLFLSVSKAHPEGSKTVHPFVTGAVVIACNIFAGPLTGPSIDPSRSFGPALVTNHWQNHWVYWVGPLLGSLLATGFFILHHTSDFLEAHNFSRYL